MTKSAGNCGFGHMYRRSPSWKTSFFVQCDNKKTSDTGRDIYNKTLKILHKAFNAMQKSLIEYILQL